jgi:hypothetical protein
MPKVTAIREGDLMVSLTADAYDYNNDFFTLEVTLMEGKEGIENDADLSGLSVNASPAQIESYLTAAMARLKEFCAEEIIIKN